MTTRINLNAYAPEEFTRRWSARAWKHTPSVIIAVPFPGGVLFGAEERNSSECVSFFLDPEDALVIGQRLMNAAKKALAK